MRSTSRPMTCGSRSSAAACAATSRSASRTSACAWPTSSSGSCARSRCSRSGWRRSVSSWACTERAMNEALVAAQQLREETRAAAQREAQVIVREAEAEALRVVEDARAAQGEVRRQSADVERQFQAYVAGFRALLERQLAELRALDGQRGG